MSVRLGISVEGQTEYRFVKALLESHLAGFGIFATPVIVATSRAASGAKSKGGGINLDRVTRELRALLSGFGGGFVTSIYDFYGFADKLPGETVEELEQRIAARLGAPPNLIPYVQRHEYEGLLLSNAAIAANYFQAPKIEALIRKAVKAAGGPEQVNDNPQTAPSKRLEGWTLKHAPADLRFSKGTKLRHGEFLAVRLTLPVIRSACPRFAAWLTKLEALGRPAPSG